MYAITPDWIIAAQDPAAIVPQDPAAIVAPAYLLAGAAVLTAILSVITAWLGRKHDHRGRAYDTRVETYSEFLVQISVLGEIYTDITKFTAGPELARCRESVKRRRLASEELNTVHDQLINGDPSALTHDERTALKDRTAFALKEYEEAYKDVKARDGDFKRLQKKANALDKRGVELRQKIRQVDAKIQILSDPATRAASENIMAETLKREPVAESYLNAFRDAARKELRLHRRPLRRLAALARLMHQRMGKSRT